MRKFICDKCEREYKKDHPALQWHWSQGKDGFGYPVGPPDHEADFCEDCLKEVAQLIYDFLQRGKNS